MPFPKANGGVIINEKEEVKRKRVISDLAIETIKLHKTYDRKVAVADLTLQVRRGEVFGFLGPNGAGKSTSVKMLLGLVKPSSGQAFVLGAPSDNVEVRRK